MNILIAEDDLTSRKLLEKVLQKLGHEPFACEDGNAAWATYQERDFQIVISDWMMPGLDGLEFCRKIRDLKQPNYCYFILLTARTGKQNFIEAMDAGADDYLTKPLDVDELKVRLRVAERILALQSDIQALRGILPICAWCKSIRDDDKLWQTVENYMASHAAVDFSHSICPKCADEQMQELMNGLG